MSLPPIPRPPDSRELRAVPGSAPPPWLEKPGRHAHLRGPVDLVYHRGRLLAAGATVAMLGFLPEHWLWTHAPVLKEISRAVGLT